MKLECMMNGVDEFDAYNSHNALRRHPEKEDNSQLTWLFVLSSFWQFKGSCLVISFIALS